MNENEPATPAEQNNAEQNTAEQNHAEQLNAEQNSAAQADAEQAYAAQSSADQANEKPTPTPATASPAFTKPIKRKTGRLVAIVAGASVLAIGATGASVATAVQLASVSSRLSAASSTQTLPGSLGTTQQGTTQQGTDGTTDGGTNGGTTDGGTSGGGNFSFGQGTLPGQGGSTTDGGTSTTTTTPDATDSQSAGVVLINTELGYLGGEAAGTGIVLTSNGEILTNNHVVEGSTTITVTIAATGKTYTATVVGTDSTDDIAVLQLTGASGLTTADIDSSGDLALGDTVTGVGNAEGQGFLSAAAGQVTATEQEITVADEVTGASKTLSGLIETDAAIVSGDSGGPLLDADGEVVGIDTAASSDTSNPTGYAIPIADALKIVDQIEAGDESGSVTLGYPAFFGVSLSTTATTTATSGAVIAGVIDGTPAADAGLAAGDTITKVDSTTITDGDQLSATIAAHDAGDSVSVTYTDAAGTSHTVTVTLIEGPAA